jgi:magnesium and cobalt transporter
MSERSLLDVISAALLREPQDREQLVDILREAEQRDLLNSESLSMIESALQLSEIQVRDVMTPQAKVAFALENQGLDEVVKLAMDFEYSRFPVYSDDGCDVRGILLAKDLLDYFFEKKRGGFQLSAILRPAFFVPESKRLDSLLREFKASHTHMAIVINEYGAPSGLVTIEDVIEQIVGEIVDEHDGDENSDNIKACDDGRFIVKALTSLEDFNLYFKTNLAHDNFDTVGGVVMHTFGYLPKRGESVVVEGFEFTVLHADHKRLRLVQVMKRS